MNQYVFHGVAHPLERVIGHLHGGNATQPTVVFFAGIHGNEPTGVLALQQVFNDLKQRKVPVNGEILGLTGNVTALSQNKRFVWRDLNRIWTHQVEDVSRLEPDEAERNGSVELRERRQLFQLIQPFFSKPSKLHFIDLHTTSSETIPFLIINDQLRNRTFAKNFPLPIVLGLEEYLEGPLLSYLNDRGYISLGFEAGQHDDEVSVSIHRSFIYQALVHSGVVDAQFIPELNRHRQTLINRKQPADPSIKSGMCFVEVLERCGIREGQNFKMDGEFANFTPVSKGQKLAVLDQHPVFANRDGYILMPRYQNIGNDGFFIVRPIPKWALKLSAILRNFNFDRMLCWIPGVRRSQDQPETLIVNLRVSRFLATKLFHLLGYRRKKSVGKQLYFSRREITTLSNDFQNEQIIEGSL